MLSLSGIVFSNLGVVIPAEGISVPPEVALSPHYGTINLLFQDDSSYAYLLPLCELIARGPPGAIRLFPGCSAS